MIIKITEPNLSSTNIFQNNVIVLVYSRRARVLDFQHEGPWIRILESLYLKTETKLCDKGSFLVA